MELENEQNGKKKWILIIVGIIVLIIIIIVALLTFGKDTKIVKQIGSVLPFGQLSSETPRGTTGSDTGDANPDDIAPQDTPKPIFMQLASGPVAGATSLTRNGKTYVRYVLRETGFVHEVDPETGIDQQLTNTTIPRIHEASFGLSGNTVVLRYLKRDPLTRQDVIKTYLANLELPLGSGTSTNTVGTLRGDHLPDNVSSVSISPDGTNLFYLLPISEGVSGTFLSLTGAQPPKEIFRNAFAEWLPQLLNNGSVLLTTKASANVPGYAYIYNPKDKTLSRLVREKKGLTTNANVNGSRVLFSENIAETPTLGLYSITGTNTGEEASIPLTTLPEKCAWGKIYTVLYCGSFTGNGQNNIPDNWYQGVTTLNDTFWSINTITEEITFIADPVKETKKNFDVILPFINDNETFLFFVNKNDSSLWSMRIPAPLNPEENITPAIDPSLSPEEQKDAIGSTAN